jgi:hypothetical protein
MEGSIFPSEFGTVTDSFSSQGTGTDRHRTVHPRNVKRMGQVQKTIQIIAIHGLAVHPPDLTRTFLKNCLLSDGDIDIRILVEKQSPAPKTIGRKKIIGIQENNIPSLDLRNRVILAALATTGQSTRFPHNPESLILTTSLFE